MCDVPVFYATSERYGRLIAERLAARVRRHGLDSRAIPIVCEETSHFDWGRVRGAAIAAAVDGGRYPAEARAFAHLNASVLSTVASLFVSLVVVSASSRPDGPGIAADRARRFATDAGWYPLLIASVSGWLRQTNGNWFARIVMRRTMRHDAAPIDTTADDIDTDWAEVERAGDELASTIVRWRGSSSPPSDRTETCSRTSALLSA